MITFKQYILEGLKRPKTGMFKDRDGNKEWYQNGELHRLDGPAKEHADGYKAWYVNNKLHRLDGPAVEYADGYKAWWINNEQFSETEFNAYKKQQKVKDAISKNNTSGWDL